MKLNIIFIYLFFDPKNRKKLFLLGLILRFSNLNVQNKGLIMQDWVFRLGWRLFYVFSKAKAVDVKMAKVPQPQMKQKLIICLVI